MQAHRQPASTRAATLSGAWRSPWQVGGCATAKVAWRQACSKLRHVLPPQHHGTRAAMQIRPTSICEALRMQPASQPHVLASRLCSVLLACGCSLQPPQKGWKLTHTHRTSALLTNMHAFNARQQQPPSAAAVGCPTGDDCLAEVRSTNLCTNPVAKHDARSADAIPPKTQSKSDRSPRPDPPCSCSCSCKSDHRGWLCALQSTLHFIAGLRLLLLLRPRRSADTQGSGLLRPSTLLVDRSRAVGALYGVLVLALAAGQLLMLRGGHSITRQAGAGWGQGRAGQGARTGGGRHKSKQGVSTRSAEA